MTIKTTVDDVKSISKGTSSIIAQWKKNCEPQKESISRSIPRAVELNSINELVLEEENDDSSVDENPLANENELPDTRVIYYRPGKSDCESGGGVFIPNPNGDVSQDECSASWSDAREICGNLEAFVTTDSFVRCGQ